MTNYKMFSEEFLGPAEKVFSIPLYIGHSISNFPILPRSYFENGQKLLMFFNSRFQRFAQNIK